MIFVIIVFLYAQIQVIDTKVQIACPKAQTSLYSLILAVNSTKYGFCNNTMKKMVDIYIPIPVNALLWTVRHNG